MPSSPENVGPGNGTNERKPSLAESFEKISRAVEKYDEDQVKGWKEDIDTLLVFAGLFSAVVTAFLIEAYQKLEEDPADKTVALLEKLISFQQPNASQTAAISSDPSPFAPDVSTIRITCFWLLSLIFSLTSALFGLLCKQWIREYQREPPTRSPAEALALRQLRRDSFEKWNVPAFLAALPILLEIALILFFVGILDLLWGLHHIPFIVSLVAVGLSAGLYFITTLLPTLTIPKDQKRNIKWRNFDRLEYQFICPYKSPQAWLVYRFVCKILHLLSKFWKSTEAFEWRYRRPAPALRYHIESPASDWSSFDLRVISQYDQHVQDLLACPQKDVFGLQVYQLRAFEWAVTMFRDSPLMIAHLQNALGTIPPPLAMSAVLGRWDVALWTDVSKADVDLAVRDPEEFQRQPFYRFLEHFRAFPTVPDLVVCEPEGIKFLFEHQSLMTQEAGGDFRAALQLMGVQTTGFHFVVPLSVTGRLWTHPDDSVRKRSISLLELYEKSWKSCSGVENVDERRYRLESFGFIRALAKHIERTDRTSVLITSTTGREFIRFIHYEIVARKFYKMEPFLNRIEWIQAIEKTREVGNLPSDYFVPLPDENDSPDLPPISPIRYALEARPDIELNQAPGSQRDREAFDGEDVLEIQAVGDPSTTEDPGSSSNPGKGHIAFPECGGRLEHSTDTGGDEPADAARTSDTQPLEDTGASVDMDIFPAEGVIAAFSAQDIHPDTNHSSTSECTIVRGATEVITSPANSHDTPNRFSALSIQAIRAAGDAEADFSPDPGLQALGTAFSECQEMESGPRALPAPAPAGDEQDMAGEEENSGSIPLRSRSSL
ncbi:hypothetical protein VNI00_006358 [Paramarasmius palmivorus]|uniref:DUF6535 domain-containing protein n=1 Tax=Paramarasmius palmivorus TaxID=297713 RepID=A0AAW0D8T9_9AGAR